MECDIGKAVRLAQAGTGLNKGEFADKAKLTRPYLSEIMSGNVTSPGFVLLTRIAAAADMKVSELCKLGEG